MSYFVIDRLIIARDASAVLATAMRVCPSVCLSVRHTPVLCLAQRKQDGEMYTISFVAP